MCSPLLSEPKWNLNDPHFKLQSETQEVRFIFSCKPHFSLGKCSNRKKQNVFIALSHISAWQQDSLRLSASIKPFVRQIVRWWQVAYWWSQPTATFKPCQPSFIPVSHYQATFQLFSAMPWDWGSVLKIWKCF